MSTAGYYHGEERRAASICQPHGAGQPDAFCSVPARASLELKSSGRQAAAPRRQWLWLRSGAVRPWRRRGCSHAHASGEYSLPLIWQLPQTGGRCHAWGSPTTVTAAEVSSEIRLLLPRQALRLPVPSAAEGRHRTVGRRISCGSRQSCRTDATSFPISGAAHHSGAPAGAGVAEGICRVKSSAAPPRRHHAGQDSSAVARRPSQNAGRHPAPPSGALWGQDAGEIGNEGQPQLLRHTLYVCDMAR